MIRVALCALALLCILVQGAAAERVRMAVTTSFHNSGLADILLPALKEETGIDVQLLVVGTGQALKLGQAGDVDAVLVHARAAEDAFVAAGHAPYRRPLMYNDFVLLGPEADPADLAAAPTAADALARVARAQAPFVSRGDDSGTHQKERAVWRAAGLNPTGSWYKPVGAGMGAALNTAVGLGAYVLSDRASWLNFGNTGTHAIVFEGDPALFNQYAFLPVATDRHPHVPAHAVRRVEDWLTAPRAQVLIDGYEIGGQRLFTFNATPRE